MLKASTGGGESLSALGELALPERIRRQVAAREAMGAGPEQTRAVFGIGDDAAVLRADR